MTQAELDAFARRAKRVYEDSIRGAVEQAHLHNYVAIEPDSGRYFLGETYSEAVAAAQAAMPNQLVHTVRVGHAAALHLGAAGL
ncbi:MAG: hypothetical protein AAF790_10075 [Planctomycetota bacterium]